MKRFLIFLTAIIVLQLPSLAKIDDYDLLYYQANLSDVKLMHDLDPFQDEEYQKYAWSPYPLFRTSSYMYFKNITLPPGYYLLTPRTLKGKDYILFKSAGKVKYIIPVVKKETTPIDFYQRQMPVPKQTKWQKFCKKTSDLFYKLAKNSKKIPPPKSFIDINLEGRYFIVKLYYGDDCYIMAFRKDQY